MQNRRHADPRRASYGADRTGGERRSARQVEGARHAMQENGGGMQGVEEAAVAIHILRH